MKFGFTAGLIPPSLTGETEISQVKKHDPTDHKIEVRDSRWSIDGDTNRFLIEIFNNLDKAIDTPSLGKETDISSNRVWAHPSQMVLPPKQPGILFGRVRDKSSSILLDFEKGWILCDEISSRQSSKLEGWDFDLSHRLDVFHSNAAQLSIIVTNKSSSLPPSGFTIHGLIRDGDNRACGNTPPASIDRVKPGESTEISVYITKDANYVANPLNFVESLDSISVQLSVQPTPIRFNPGCPAFFL